MSRSNPTEHSQHPCTRWIEWSGSEGELRYYDKTAKKNVSIADGFTFILLDQLSTIKGWHDPSESGIHSNEVRDTKQETFVVKAFKGGVIAEGHYQTIRDRVAAMGGNFTQNCYVAFKNESGELAIGSVQFKGAALNAWIEFSKAHRGDLYKKAIYIKGYTEGKKGKIVFRTPKFFIKDITPETDQEATELDRQLQAFLKGYFGRTRVEQVEQATSEAEPDVDHAPQDDPPESHGRHVENAAEEFDDIPFSFEAHGPR